MTLSLDDIPEGLWVEVDDAMHVELGPARPRTWTPRSAVAFAVLSLGTAGGLAVDAPELALAGFLLGCVALAGVRLWEFARHDAALRLSYDERGLRLERHHRDRILWTRTLRWSRLAGCTVGPGPSLVLTLREGARLVLRVPFRTSDQMSWVATRLQEGLDRQQAFEAEGDSPERDRVQRLVGAARTRADAPQK